MKQTCAVMIILADERIQSYYYQLDGPIVFNLVVMFMTD